MNHRSMTGLITLGLSVAAVPTITAAHSHYTGRVPASIAAADPGPAPVTMVPLTARPVATHAATRTVTHGKVAKHVARHKKHKRKHKAKA